MGDCDCTPCVCDPPNGDRCECPDPPCDCGKPKDECVCKPCECDDPKDRICVCDPCPCETPPQSSPKDPPATPQGEVCDNTFGRGFTLNEFIRAKEYFLTTSNNSGLNMYDHMTEVLRKMLDARAPPNCVDFLEELSLNVKRYRFGMPKDLVRDSFYLSPSLVYDAMSVMDNWQKYAHWSREELERGGEDDTFGGFPNLMRLLYYLEQINVGLPRDEMFRIALALRQLNLTHPIKRSRFWGKIYGIDKNYYVVEAELGGPNYEDLWIPSMDEEPDIVLIEQEAPPTDNFISGTDTYQKASSAVTDPSILVPFQQTSGVPPGPLNCIVPHSIMPLNENLGETEEGGEGYETTEEPNPEAIAEALLWESYQKELTEGFPYPPKLEEDILTQPEANGRGLNRRAFYVANELGEKWLLLPDITPKQINTSRRMRRFLTGNLDAKLDVYPEFGGREGHYLKTLLARVTAGSQVSPKGYFKRIQQIDEDEDEEEELEEEEEEDDELGSDKVFAVKKYRPPLMNNLLTQPPELWVHHTSHILKQGRTTWWNSQPPKENEEEELGEEEEEEENRNDGVEPEYGPRLFNSLINDETFEGFSPWSPRSSSTVFSEFQVAYVRSNVWPGASSFCTYKGKAENIYFGDAMKFRGTCFAPQIPSDIQTEYKEGPELTEVDDPTYAQEQEWLGKLELQELNDVEEKFVDEEESEPEGEEEEEE